MVKSKQKAKIALITGVTGQDGSYLAELLLEKGYKVFGIQRRSSTFNTSRIDHLHNNPKYNKNFVTVYGDLADSSNLVTMLDKIKPDEIYNLGAQSHVAVSFQIPEYTANVTGLGALRILEAIHRLRLKTKFYQASSSEMFGKVLTTPQSETTPFNPQSPYGISKTFAFWITRSYREGYGIFASNGILFNHESPRRGETFVTRKITMGLSRVKLGLQDVLELGNLEAKRDWGYAKDYVEAIWLILQHKKPEDFLISTGETHSVREFVEEVGKNLGYNIAWRGKGIKEVGFDTKTGKALVKVNPGYFRPTEVDALIGDSSKALKILGWKSKVTFTELARIMTEHDLNYIKEKVSRKSKIEHN